MLAVIHKRSLRRPLLHRRLPEVRLQKPRWYRMEFELQ